MLKQTDTPRDDSADILSNIRVLDFGRFIAGPYCASLLGALGADVIRVERLGGSEDRNIMPLGPTGDGALFMQVNANKRSLGLNLRSPMSKIILRRLVESADIVIANLPDNTLRALQLDEDSLRAIKPNIIVATSNTFGYGNQYQNEVGFDAIGQAMSGIMYFSGQPDAPAKTAVQLIDFTTAFSATIGILAALMARQQSGIGQRVNTSLLASALTLANSLLIEQAVLQTNRQPSGNRSQVVAPSDVFRTSDGWVVIQVVGPYLFKRLCRLLNKPEWLTDERFTDDASRGKNNEIINAWLVAWCLERTTANVLESLRSARIPGSAVLSLQESLDSPFVQAGKHFQPLPFPGVHPDPPITIPPFQLSQSAVELRRRAPVADEHSVEILQDLAFSVDEIEQFVTSQVIRKFA